MHRDSALAKNMAKGCGCAAGDQSHDDLLKTPLRFRRRQLDHRFRGDSSESFRQENRADLLEVRELPGGLPSASSHLYFPFSRLNECSSSAQEPTTLHAETYIPAEPAASLENPRLSHANEDPGRTRGHLATQGEGPQTSICQTRLS